MVVRRTPRSSSKPRARATFAWRRVGLYLSQARKLVAHFMKPPTELGEADVREFHLHLRVPGKKPAQDLAFAREMRDDFARKLGGSKAHPVCEQRKAY
jgi:hypothetical protein